MELENSLLLWVFVKQLLQLSSILRANNRKVNLNNAFSFVFFISVDSATSERVSRDVTCVKVTCNWRFHKKKEKATPHVLHLESNHSVYQSVLNITCNFTQLCVIQKVVLKFKVHI